VRLVSENIVFHRGAEPVPVLRHSLYVLGLGNRVAQCVPDSRNRGIQPVLEIDKRLLRPDAPAKFLAGDGGSGMFEKRYQQQERLGL
jgi:hypothetical protein